MKTFGPHKAMTFYFSIAVASGLLVFACAQSRQKHPVDDAVAAEDAGARAQTSEAGDANGAPIGAKLDRQEAEALIPEFIYQRWPQPQVKAI